MVTVNPDTKWRFDIQNIYKDELAVKSALVKQANQEKIFEVIPRIARYTKAKCPIQNSLPAQGSSAVHAGPSTPVAPRRIPRSTLVTRPSDSTHIKTNNPPNLWKVTTETVGVSLRAGEGVTSTQTTVLVKQEETDIDFTTAMNLLHPSLAQVKKEPDTENLMEVGAVPQPSSIKRPNNPTHESRRYSGASTRTGPRGRAFLRDAARSNVHRRDQVRYDTPFGSSPSIVGRHRSASTMRLRQRPQSGPRARNHSASPAKSYELRGRDRSRSVEEGELSAEEVRVFEDHRAGRSHSPDYHLQCPDDSASGNRASRRASRACFIGELLIGVVATIAHR